VPCKVTTNNRIRIREKVSNLDEIAMKVVRMFPEVGVCLQSLVFGTELHKPAVVVSEGTLDGGRAVRGVVEQPCYLLVRTTGQ
jgi:hypothetical protein